MSQFFNSRFFFLLKTLSCMFLFLCCLALFLYGVIWVATLLFCLPKYLWLNIEIIRYKSFIVLLIPTLLWGIWWFIYVFKNQNEIIITKLKASLLDETKHKLHRPSPEEAARFSFECSPEYLFQFIGRTLPFGCHAWRKFQYEEFWSKYIH